MNSLINIKDKDLDFDNVVIYVNVTKNRKALIIPMNTSNLKKDIDRFNILDEFNETQIKMR